MADISDQNLQSALADTSCLGRLVADSQAVQNLAPGEAATGGRMAQLPSESGRSCLEFTPINGLAADIGNRLDDQPKTASIDASGQFESTRPYFAVASNLAGGQPLSFDSNFRRLEFNAPTATEDQTKLGNLGFERKPSAALIFGVNMRF